MTEPSAGDRYTLTDAVRRKAERGEKVRIPSRNVYEFAHKKAIEKELKVAARGGITKEARTRNRIKALNEKRDNDPSAVTEEMLAELAALEEESEPSEPPIPESAYSSPATRAVVERLMPRPKIRGADAIPDATSLKFDEAASRAASAEEEAAKAGTAVKEMKAMFEKERKAREAATTKVQGEINTTLEQLSAEMASVRGQVQAAQELYTKGIRSDEMSDFVAYQRALTERLKVMAEQQTAANRLALEADKAAAEANLTWATREAEAEAKYMEAQGKLQQVATAYLSAEHDARLKADSASLTRTLEQLKQEESQARLALEWEDRRLNQYIQNAAIERERIKAAQIEKVAEINAASATSLQQLKDAAAMERETAKLAAEAAKAAAAEAHATRIQEMTSTAARQLQDAKLQHDAAMDATKGEREAAERELKKLIEERKNASADRKIDLDASINQSKLDLEKRKVLWELREKTAAREYQVEKDAADRQYAREKTLADQRLQENKEERLRWLDEEKFKQEITKTERDQRMRELELQATQANDMLKKQKEDAEYRAKRLKEDFDLSLKAEKRQLEETLTKKLADQLEGKKFTDPNWEYRQLSLFRKQKAEQLERQKNGGKKKRKKWSPAEIAAASVGAASASAILYNSMVHRTTSVPQMSYQQSFHEGFHDFIGTLRSPVSTMFPTTVVDGGVPSTVRPPPPTRPPPRLPTSNTPLV